MKLLATPVWVDKGIRVNKGGSNRGLRENQKEIVSWNQKLTYSRSE